LWWFVLAAGICCFVSGEGLLAVSIPISNRIAEADEAGWSFGQGWCRLSSRNERKREKRRQTTQKTYLYKMGEQRGWGCSAALGKVLRIALFLSGFGPTSLQDKNHAAFSARALLRMGSP